MTDHRILGSLRSADGAGVVRMEDRYDTGIDDLWAAITDPDRVARCGQAWKRNPKPGSVSRYRGWDGSGSSLRRS
jgi:hypothetical protein